MSLDSLSVYELYKPDLEQLKAYVASQISLVFAPVGRAMAVAESVEAVQGADGTTEAAADFAALVRLIRDDQPHSAAIRPYFSIALRSFLLTSGFYYSFHKALVLLNALSALEYDCLGTGARDPQILADFGYCLLVFIAYYYASIGTSFWLLPDSNAGVTAELVTEAMARFGCDVSSPDLLVQRIATGNFLFTLTDEQLDGFESLGFARDSFQVFTHSKFSEVYKVVTGSAPVVARFFNDDPEYDLIHFAATSVITRCTELPFKPLVDFTKSEGPVGKWVPGGALASLPFNPPDAYQRLMQLKLADLGKISACAEQDGFAMHALLYTGDLLDKTVLTSPPEKCPLCESGAPASRGSIDPNEPLPHEKPQVQFYAAPEGYWEGKVKDYEPGSTAPLRELGENLEKGFLTEEFAGLGPVEVHLLRLIAYSGIAAWKAGNKVGVAGDVLVFFKHQFRCVLVSLGRLLFPDTPSQSVLPAVKLFVLAVLAELGKELPLINGVQREPGDPIPEFRHAFADALGAIIPGVFQNLGKLALLAAPPDRERRARYERALAAPPVLQPLSWKRHLVAFLVSPPLRLECPVTYAYCRLSGRFATWKLLAQLSAPLQELRDGKPEEEDASKEKGHSKPWNFALDAIVNGVLTPEAREALKNTRLEDGGLLDPELLTPRKLDAWPLLLVLEGLTVAHNQFVRTLQRHTVARVGAISHDYLTPDEDAVHFDLTTCNGFAIRSYRGDLQEDGIPAFGSASEARLVKSFEATVPYVITLSYLDEIIVAPGVTSESPMAAFQRLFGKSTNITAEQRRALRIHVKETGKAAGLQLLFERVVRQILKDGVGSANPDDAISEYIQTKFPKDKRDGFPLIERTAEAAFAAARNATGDQSTEFSLRRLVKIYEFLGDPGEDLMSPPDGGLAQLMVARFSQLRDVTESDIGQYSEPTDPPEIRSVIAKVIASGVPPDPASPLHPFLLDWSNRPNAVALLSKSEGEALGSLLHRVETQGKEKFTIKDLAGFFPK